MTHSQLPKNDLDTIHVLNPVRKDLQLLYRLQAQQQSQDTTPQHQQPSNHFAPTWFLLQVFQPSSNQEEPISSLANASGQR